MVSDAVVREVQYKKAHRGAILALQYGYDKEIGADARNAQKLKKLDIDSLFSPAAAAADEFYLRDYFAEQLKAWLNGFWHHVLSVPKFDVHQILRLISTQADIDPMTVLECWGDLVDYHLSDDDATHLSGLTDKMEDLYHKVHGGSFQDEFLPGHVWGVRVNVLSDPIPLGGIDHVDFDAVERCLDVPKVTQTRPPQDSGGRYDGA